VDVEALFPAHGQAAELVQQGEGLLDDVAQLAETFEASDLALRDDRFGATMTAGPAERVAVVTLVGEWASKRRRGRPRRPAIQESRRAGRWRG